MIERTLKSTCAFMRKNPSCLASTRTFVNNRHWRVSLRGAAALVILLACVSSSIANEAINWLSGDARLPFSPGVKIPAGYDIYYFSGATAAVANPTAPKGSVESYGDIATQTRSALDSLKSSLAKFGLTFADVVQARVFMTRDPSKAGGVDFARMSKVWGTEFGTASQPSKPVRAAVEVAGLIAPGLLIEIEMTAAKKPAPR
jgi:enamine deaminase RidA (YjgF/YER057c/UK114 family)